MKKFFSCLLAVLMMAALLVGCGQQQTDAPGNDAPDQPAGHNFAHCGQQLRHRPPGTAQGRTESSVKRKDF